MGVRRVAVVGTGLIGASVGLAAREAGATEVRGWDVAAVVDASDDGATVTDVGSTKGAVTRAVRDNRFIGGHPVCGSEARGPGHASAELFEGAAWFLTPLTETEPERYRLLHGF